MTNFLLDRTRNFYHQMFAEETRTRLYFLAPRGIQRLWDRLGSEQGPAISEKDVLFLARLLWFHEPSAESIDRWHNHATRLNYDFKKLAHDMQHDIEATQHEQELRYSQVPADVDYVNYGTRIFLRREASDQERNKWLKQAQEKVWSFDGLVSTFKQSEEYRQRLQAESEPHLVELDQFKIYVRLGDHFTSGPIAQNREYEPVVTSLIGAIVRPGDYVVDVGANVGYHALSMANVVGAQGKVFAFEPLPGNCELIALSAEANKLTNLELFPDAAGSEAGEIEIMVEGAHTNARINTNPEFDSRTAKKFPVRVVKIDDCLHDIPRLRFVKIDVEGAEPLAIAGMSELITRFKPALLFEFYPDFIRMTSQTDPQQFLYEMIDYGYQLRVIDQDPVISEPLQPLQIMDIHVARGRTHVDILALTEDFVCSLNL